MKNIWFGFSKNFEILQHNKKICCENDWIENEELGSIHISPYSVVWEVCEDYKILDDEAVRQNSDYPKFGLANTEMAG